MKYKVTTTHNLFGIVYADGQEPQHEKVYNTLALAKCMLIAEGTSFFREMVLMYGKRIQKYDVGRLMDGRIYCQVWVRIGERQPIIESIQKFIGIEGA